MESRDVKEQCRKYYDACRLLNFDPMLSGFERSWARSSRRFVIIPCLVFFLCLDSLFYSTQQGKLFSSYITPVFLGNSNRAPVVDILSVGTLLKDEYHKAQRRTFGQHAAVRHFFAITEREDTDAACFTSLTTDQMRSVLEFCQQQLNMGTNPFRFLFFPKEHIGWLCSQKRPLDGLYHVLQQYKSYTTNGTISLPDYMILTELDTYLNMEALLSDLRRHHPVHIPSAVAGCQMKVELEAGISFPHLGFGAILTKAAIQRLLQPVYCNRNDPQDHHSRRACWRLQQNALGEHGVFTEGMSVADLMHAYTSRLPYTGVASWTDTGYCLHSNNFYHIQAFEDTGLKEVEGVPTDELLRQNSFGQLAGRDETECTHEKQKCSPEHRVCHGIDPADMDSLHQRTISDLATRR